MKKLLLLVLSVLCLALLIGCASQEGVGTDEELEAEMEDLSDEELDAVVAQADSNEEQAVAGQAVAKRSRLATFKRSHFAQKVKATRAKAATRDVLSVEGEQSESFSAACPDGAEPQISRGGDPAPDRGIGGGDSGRGGGSVSECRMVCRVVNGETVCELEGCD